MGSMRIVAGYLGGRTLEAPRGYRTHPMSDKVRGALFSALGDITKLTVLDTFAGSGALAFEAVSRGAQDAVAIEIDKAAHRIITSNIATLQLQYKVKAIRANVSSWSDNNPDKLFDIVLCDPPYNDLQPAIVQKISHHVSPHGIFVLSWPGSGSAPDISGFEVAAKKSYGDAQLIFYKHL